MRRLFLSDVHLSPRHPARTARLLRFLRREAGRADEIYILGDLFDYWIGPRHLALPDYRESLEALARVAAARPVFFLLGNRDFYVGRGFEEATGIRVVPGRTAHRLATAAARVYLCHGDYLEGRSGLGFRIQEWIRSPGFEARFIRLPARLARAMAEFYRWLSGRKTRRPSRLSQEAVRAEFAAGADVIVCGHVHEPRRVSDSVDGRHTLLFTLGDWFDGESYLVEEDGQWTLYGDGGRTL
jgi:UDP-2,3-diacylglucosamine hydrolase